MNPTIGQKIYVKTRMPGVTYQGIYLGIDPLQGHIISADAGPTISFTEWYSNSTGNWNTVI